MLSRVAERLYWMARYLERAENTARIINVYGNLMLDLPRGVGLHWRQVIDITGSRDVFGKAYDRAGEQRIIKFVLVDERNPGSLLNSLTAARENVRTSRDQMPSEAWESVNELYLFGRKKLNSRGRRQNLHEVMSSIVMHCQQITGLLTGTMSHGAGYHFVRLGRNLERADMTTRILDVGSATLVAPGGELERLENRLWMNVLRAVSGHQMYRQNIRRRIRRDSVFGFLLHDTGFPRAFAHSLLQIQDCLEKLPHNDAPLRAVARLERIVAETYSAAVVGGDSHRFLDELQEELGQVHRLITEAWFLPELHEAV
jgi:uncharacterized alpha-E superfamily protein